MTNPWVNLGNFYKELMPTNLSEAYEKQFAESMATVSEQPKMVNPATLLTIGMLQAWLWLRSSASPTSTLLGWEKEAHAFLSGVSIYGVPVVNPSSSQKAN